MAVKKTTKKKKAKRAEKPPDLREHLPPTAANLTATLAGVRASVASLTVPAEPEPGDLVNVVLHITLAEGVPCGIGQECVRRIDAEFVDRNEFRLTEAFEVETLLADLGIPNLFQRALRARDAVAEIYNDQNDITLAFLREASITDRNMFFQRVPVLKPHVTHFLVAILAFEEIVFSDRSTLRTQQRLGLDAKKTEVLEFIGELKQLIRPFGHLPLRVGPDVANGKPRLEPALSVASHLVRLAPPVKRR